MSSSNPGYAPMEKKKKGFSKYVTKMKNVFKDSQHKRKSDIPPVAVPGIAGEAGGITADEQDITIPSARAKADQPDPPRSGSQSRQDRVRRLAEKYGVELGPFEWKDHDAVERVEKPIRMRVHRSCHKCGTMFGASKLCDSCGHTRCKGCPRHPKKRLAGKNKGIEVVPIAIKPSSHHLGDALASEAIERPKRAHTLVLTKPSRTGGQDLVRKQPRQRVRRTCHCCQVMFRPGNKECPSCGHIRCWDCPRDPAKLDKYPDGYPGDAQPDPDPNLPRDKPRRVVRYLCHQCKTIFKNGDVNCPSCSHEKCPDCPKVPPRKVKPQPDPEVVKRVQERLAAMSLGRKTADRDTTTARPLEPDKV